MTLWSRGLWRSSDKLKSLYLHYQSAYGYHTWQESNLPCWTLAYKIAWSFDYVVLRNYITNYHTTTLPQHLWPTNVVGLELILTGFWAKGQMNLWSLSLVRSPDKLKSLYLRYDSAYSNQTWQDGNFIWWASTYIVTWLLDYVVLTN